MFDGNRKIYFSQATHVESGLLNHMKSLLPEKNCHKRRDYCSTSLGNNNVQHRNKRDSYFQGSYPLASKHIWSYRAQHEQRTQRPLKVGLPPSKFGYVTNPFRWRTEFVCCAHLHLQAASRMTSAVLATGARAGCLRACSSASACSCERASPPAGAPA